MAEIIINESKKHQELKRIAVRKLEKMGCEKIQKEFKYYIGEKRFVFDVVGMKETGMVVIECGHVKKEKIEAINKSEEIIEFIHLDYDCKEGLEAQENAGETFVRILIGNTETGETGMKAPTKTISLKGITVKEIHKKIMEMIENIK